MTDLEKLLVTALRDAWDVLNAIRARDGAPYHRDDGMPYFDPAYFDALVEECDAAIEVVNEAFAYLESTLRRIEELTTDTPTWGDQERALDAIKGECQEALSAVSPTPHNPTRQAHANRL